MRARLITLMTVATLANLIVAGYPVWVIRPFVAQPPRALTWAIQLRDIGPWTTLAGLAVILACAIWLLAHPRSLEARLKIEPAPAAAPEFQESPAENESAAAVGVQAPVAAQAKPATKPALPRLASALARGGRAMGWHARRWAAGYAGVLAVILGGLTAYIAHVDYFQWMFHPDHDVRTVSIAQSHWPDRAMVLDVVVHGQARAYPIHEMGYYHIVNDRLGGEPIAATY